MVKCNNQDIIIILQNVGEVNIFGELAGRTTLLIDWPYLYCHSNRLQKSILFQSIGLYLTFETW